jgi:hypothetical protein
MWGATIVVVGLLGVGGVAVAGANPNVFEVTGRETHAAEVPPPGHDSFVGARFVGADELYDDGDPVGTAGRSCEVVATAHDGTAQFQCVVTLQFATGSLTLQGLPTLAETGFEPFDAAVTGGTGPFRHARGTATITPQGPTELSYRIDLR